MMAPQSCWPDLVQGLGAVSKFDFKTLTIKLLPFFLCQVNLEQGSIMTS